jgi:hypothetical protein
MLRSLGKRELVEQFAEQFRRAQTPLMLDLERAVCGCDYGATGWTTRDEACLGRLNGLFNRVACRSELARE